jgi:transposase InsO family protein
MRSPAAATSQPCTELRLREREDVGREDGTDAEPDRRTQQRVPAGALRTALADVMVIKGVPEHLRSDNGPEFVARDLGQWLANTGAKTLYIEPDSPWENGFCESFNAKSRDELLNGEIFYSMKEIRVLAGELALPLTVALLVAAPLILLLGSGLSSVIRARLAGGKRFGREGKHDS